MLNIGNKHIEVFLAAAGTLSFTQTAETLYSTQSTVSRTIRQMEDEIGAMLFYRGRFSLSLTPAGEYLLRELERIQDDLAVAFEHTKLLDGQRADRVRVGIYSYSLLELVHSRYLQDFERLHTQIDIAYSFSNLSDEQLKTDALDLIIIPDIDFEHRDSYDSMMLMEASLLLLCSKDNPIAQCGHPVAEDFRQQTLRTVFHPQMLRSFQMDTLNYFGVKAANIAQASNAEDLFLRRRQGNCFTLLDDYCASIDTGRFFRYELPDGCTKVTFRLFWLTGSQNPALAALLKHLQNKLQQNQG